MRGVQNWNAAVVVIRIPEKGSNNEVVTLQEMEKIISWLADVLKEGYLEVIYSIVTKIFLLI